MPSLCNRLNKIALNYIGTPITIVLDNARYQKCSIVAAYAKTLGIELLYLPTYSPNLNLIERLWKYIKKEVLQNRYHENFGAYKEAIVTALDEISTTRKDDIASLLAPNFHIEKKDTRWVA